MKEPFKNLVDFTARHNIFKNPAYSYSVSGRWIGQRIDVMRYLQIYFIYLDGSQIESVFGSTTHFSDFYGGRLYDPQKSIDYNQVDVLSQHNINLALTLTNHFYSPELFEKNVPFLERYHRTGNIIICTSDDLAKQIRSRFPLYKLRASIIKNLNTLEKVKRAFDLYDDVVIPMDLNDDDDFLWSLPEKERIMLFANAACAYTCPARICYAAISKVNQAKGNKVRCKKEELGLLEYAFYFFDVDKFFSMGYSNFKLIPAKLFADFLQTRPELPL